MFAEALTTWILLWLCADISTLAWLCPTREQTPCSPSFQALVALITLRVYRPPFITSKYQLAGCFTPQQYHRSAKEEQKELGMHWYNFFPSDQMFRTHVNAVNACWGGNMQQGGKLLHDFRVFCLVSPQKLVYHFRGLYWTIYCGLWAIHCLIERYTGKGGGCDEILCQPLTSKHPSSKHSHSVWDHKPGNQGPIKP